MTDPTPPDPLQQLDPHDYSARIVRQKMWRRMNVDNQHFMGAIVGREGTGKSHSALTLARTVDPEFTAEDVFFDPQDLLEAFDSDEYSAGNMIVLDEAGVGLGNRSWYEKEQILLNQTLQTVRDDNMGVLFTLPRLEELDSQTIGRLHGFVEMLDVNPAEGWASAKWKNINLTRDGRGRTYKKYTRLNVGGVEKRITRFAVSAPPDDLVSAYEGRKEAFKEQLYEDAIAAYDEGNKDSQELEPDDVVDTVIEEDRVDEFVSHHGQTGRAYVDKDLLADEFGLSVRKSNVAKKKIEQSVAIQ
jgi:hypothetical protein